ncbi:MAG TPA: PAS domain S-box protein [Thermomicrobiales bacterium]|nr:PAS domain S-box protein [Thermomicrobiales bacterium]
MQSRHEVRRAQQSIGDSMDEHVPAILDDGERAVFDAMTDGILLLGDLGTRGGMAVIDVNPALCSMTGYRREELIGTDALRLVARDDWRRAVTIARSIRARGSATGVLTAVREDGSTFDAELSISLLSDRRTPHGLVIIRDISERLQHYRHLERRVEERTRELETLLAVAESLASTLDLPALLGLVLDQLKVVVDHSSSAIMTRDGDDMVILEARDYRFVDARAGPVPAGFRFPMAHAGRIWEELSQRKAVIIGDVRGDEQFAAAYRATVGAALTTTFGDVRSYLAIPLASRERVFGFVRLSWPEPNGFTARHAELATAFANQVAIAIENTRLFEAAQQHAAVEERQRLARELHDSVTQSLFSLTLFARAAEIGLVQAGIDPAGPVGSSIGQLRTLTHGALAEMRALIFELRPDALAEEGLVAALQRQAAALTAREGLLITVDGPTARLPLAPEVEEHLYRLTLEALHNTLKHASAVHAWVTISSDDEQVLVEIGDDGCGFDPTVRRPGHFGLTTMADRAMRIGGQLVVESALGQGTRTRVTVPGQQLQTGAQA